MKKATFQPIVCFSLISLDPHIALLSVSLGKVVENFTSYQSVVTNQSPRNESTLIRADYVMQNRFKSISYGFSDNLEGNIAKRDESELTRKEGVISFRDETNVGVVESRGVTIVVEDVENFFSYILPNYIPVCMVEMGWKAIRTWGCQALHVFNGLVNFFSCEVFLKIVMILLVYPIIDHLGNISEAGGVLRGEK
jgi:hypothetical protein